MTVDELKHIKDIVFCRAPIINDKTRTLLNELIDAEIERQSVSDQDVQRVMYEMEDKTWQSWENGYPIRLSDNDAELIRTALEQMAKRKQ